MMWQDIWISIGTWIFAVVLFPQLKDAWYGKPMNIYTALGTGAILWSFAIVFSTLSLWMTSFANIVTASTWTLIGLFSVIRRQ